uniref:LIM domain binding 2a n=1 Tax=Astyanax mexicanus TaxID=7994 RepID=A0A8B9GT75_ASTMX
MSNPPHDPFYSSPFAPFYRRHAPYVVQPEYRIYELNKRLQSRTEESDNLWWDAFATEFFEEDATLTLSFCLEDGPKRYSKTSLSVLPLKPMGMGGVTQ